MPRPTLDEIRAAADAVLQEEAYRGKVARMADEVEAIKREDWKAPEGVDYFPIIEKAAPLDWFIRGEIEKSNGGDANAND